MCFRFFFFFPSCGSGLFVFLIILYYDFVCLAWTCAPNIGAGSGCSIWAQARRWICWLFDEKEDRNQSSVTWSGWSPTRISNTILVIILFPPKILQSCGKVLCWYQLWYPATYKMDNIVVQYDTRYFICAKSASLLYQWHVLVISLGIITY